jgi:hypothetical protein
MRITIRPAGAERVFGRNASSDADALMLRMVVVADGVVEVGAGAGTEFVVVVGVVGAGAGTELVPVVAVAPVAVDEDVEVVVVWRVDVPEFVGPVEVVELLDPPQAAKTGASAKSATAHNAPRRRVIRGRCMGSPR